MKVLFIQILILLNLNFLKAQTRNSDFIPILETILIYDNFYLQIASAKEDSLQAFIFASSSLQKNDDTYQLARYAPRGRYFSVKNCNVDLFKSWIAFPERGHIFLVIDHFENDPNKAKLTMHTSSIVYQNQLSEKYVKMKFTLLKKNGNWTVIKRKKRQVNCCDQLD
jgi:hypothetical protein